MNRISSNHTSQTTSVIAFAFGAVMVTEPPVWPSIEIPNYRIENSVTSSYSLISDQFMNDTEQQYSVADFARDMASIFVPLNQKQQRLGEEFEKALFKNLESLYEA